MHRQDGLTLIELLATLAILAVLAGAGLPAFRTSLERHRIATAMFLASAHFASARSTAITTGDVVSLCPTQDAAACVGGSNWNRDWMMYRSRKRARQPDKPEDVLRRVQKPAHASIRLVTSSGRPALHFLPDGRSAGSNLRMRICLEGKLRAEVVVNNLGRVRSRRLPGMQACTT